MVSYSKSLAIVSPNMMEEYWRCHGPRADFLHIWWTCKKFFKIKKGVNRHFVPLSPRVMLLDFNFGRITVSVNKEVLANMLKAAKWKLEETPSLQKWLIKIKYM